MIPHPEGRRPAIFADRDHPAPRRGRHRLPLLVLVVILLLFTGSGRTAVAVGAVWAVAVVAGYRMTKRAVRPAGLSGEVEDDSARLQ
ncbi:hypothetical protein SAMN04244553_6547 [Nocardia amikacinitolerans]|uniref:Uncharacterized protein n=1 Tax=Nocardia amikacinitolerans TaxID=756689 RepID=A0A285LX97_9NOCA|nr:hypothetical protein SAMN04244553_6547 [Nocardia amikacinitolerans]